MLPLLPLRLEESIHFNPPTGHNSNDDNDDSDRDHDDETAESKRGDDETIQQSSVR